MQQVYTKKTKQIRKAILLLSLKLAFAFFLCIAFLIGIYFIPQNLTYEYSEEIPEADEQEAYNRTEQTQDLCTLRIYNGKIGVFDRQGKLLEVVDIDTTQLPEYDLALLSEGIVAQECQIREICESLIS